MDFPTNVQPPYSSIFSYSPTLWHLQQALQNGLVESVQVVVFYTSSSVGSYAWGVHTLIALRCRFHPAGFFLLTCGQALLSGVDVGTTSGPGTFQKLQAAWDESSTK